MNKKFTKLMAALALLVFMAPNMVGWGQTIQQLTNANIVAAGTGQESYQLWSITDGNDNTWDAYAIKKAHSNATSDYHYLQIKKYASSTAYYIQVPELGTQITSITMTVSGSSQPMNGGSNSATLFFSNSNSTSSTGTGVASGTGSSSVTIDCSDLNLNTGYITASGAVRIWDVSVTYTTSGSTTPSISITPASAQPFTYVVGNGPSAEQVFEVTGSNLTSDITASVPEDCAFEITDDETYGNSVTIGSGDYISVRMKAGKSAGTYNAILTLSSEGADAVTVSLTGTVVNPSYTIEQYSSPATTHGTITFNPTSPVEAGQSVAMTATPADGYVFVADSWVFYKESGNDFVIDNSITATNGNTITMPFYNLYVDATFTAKPTYAITTSVTPENSGTIETEETAWEGKEVVVLVEAATGYVFSSIVVSKTDDANTTIATSGDATNGFTFTMPAYAVTVTGTFEEFIDYTTLPFNWAGGSLANLKALTGVTTDITASDYNSGTHSPYLIKFENNKYIQVKCNEQPGKVSFAVKMIGGSTSSTIIVQGSDDGDTFTDVQTFTVSGNQNDIKSFETTNDFAASNRYVRIKKGSSGSNVGVGPISIAKYTAPAVIKTLTLGELNNVNLSVYDDPNGSPIATVENDEAQIAVGATVYVSIEGVDEDCKLFDGLTVTYGQSTAELTEEEAGVYYSFEMPNADATLTASTDDATEYTLTVAGLEHVSFEMYVGSESSDMTSLDANHQASICEESMVEINILTVGYGYVLESVTLTTPGSEPVELTKDAASGLYIFEMPSSNATLAFITGNASYFEAFTGELTEGDYVIVYNGKAMKNSVASNRLDYIEVTATNDIICADNSIIWHIAPSGDYWTIYNAAVNKYAAATGSKNQAQLLTDGTDDKALWTATGNTTYEFENKARAAASSNADSKWLRNNGNYGFACYASSTGGALSLYKKVTPQNYTTMDIEPNQWYFIASPTGTSPVDVNVLSDLYYYDEQDHHWRNQKVFANAEGFVNFDLGKGYLCANTGESAVTLTFTGVAMTNDSYTVDLDYHATTTEGETNTLAGWNLVGNPFTSNAYIARSYYVIGIDDETGKSIIVASEIGAIAPYTGVMVQAEGEGESVTFTTNAPGNPSNGNLQMTVAQQMVTRDGVSTGSTTIDNAIVSFNEGSRLGKFYFGENDANIYIPQNGKEYAIVSAEAQGELPLNFRANENGKYTLTVNPEGVEMNYLHLIDNMTGANIDLLSTPAYIFNATTKDYESRFRLVFSANNAIADAASEETFAFFSNGSLIVNNEGEATLQVVDVMGRVVSNQTVNGTTELSLNQVPGVYVLRLVSGDNVRTQKVIVK